MNQTFYLVTALVSLATFTGSVSADQIQLANGDKISGSLVSADEVNVVIASPLLGTIKLLRADVRSIRFGTTEQIEADIKKEHAAAIHEATKHALAKQAQREKPIAKGKLAAGKIQPGNQPAVEQGANAAGNEIDAAMKQLQQIFPGAGGALIEGRVRGQLNQVLSGKIGIGDIRNQAADASKQLRDMKKDLQKIGGWSPMYDMYLGVLDNFVERADNGEGLTQ